MKKSKNNKFDIELFFVCHYKKNDHWNPTTIW